MNRLFLQHSLSWADLSWCLCEDGLCLAVSLRTSSMFYSYLFDLKDGNANVCQEQEGDPWTFQMSEILLQLRHIHYKNPQRPPPHTHSWDVKHLQLTFVIIHWFLQLLHVLTTTWKKSAIKSTALRSLHRTSQLF